MGGTTTDPVLQDDAGMFCWDSANNRLGIGTGSPLEQVHIQGSGKALLLGTAISTGETCIYFGLGTGTGTQWQRIRYAYTGSDLNFERKSNTGVWTSIMTLDWTQSFVGIGMTDPKTQLDVAGAVTLGPVQSGFGNPPTGKATLYVESVSGVPTLRVKFENGIVKTLASGS